MQKISRQHLFVDFPTVFDFIHREKMEQILAYGLPQRNCYCYMMLYKNRKAMVHPPNSSTDFFDIVIGVLLEDTLATFVYNQSIFRTTNVNRSNKRK